MVLILMGLIGCFMKFWSAFIRKIIQTTLKLLQTFSNALDINILSQWPIKNLKDKFHIPRCWHTDTITNMNKVIGMFSEN